MGKLQDNQYNSFKPRNKKPPKSNIETDKNSLLQQFCPPLDSTLIEAIFADTHDYAQSYTILKELAKEADTALDVELTQTAANFDPVYNDGNNSNDSNGNLGDSSSTTTRTHATSSCTSDTDSTVYDTQEQRDDTGFLALCFPNMDHHRLLEVLRSQDGDVEKATDVLLNNVYLDADDSSAPPPTQDDNDGDLIYHGITKKSKQKNRRNNNSNGSNSNNKKSKQLLWSSRYIERTADDDDDLLTSLPFNYWHQYDDVIGQIHQVFPTVSRTLVHGCVQRCKGNIIAAVVMLMTKSPSSTQPVLYWQLATNLDQVEQGMAAVLVDRTVDQIRRIAVGVVIQCQNDHDVTQMIQQGIDFSLTFEKQQQQLEKRMASMSLYSATGAGATGPQPLLSARPTATSSKNSDLPVIPEYLLINNQHSYTEDDPELCRMMAMDLIFNRNELFQKAAAAYRSSKNKKTGEQGVAFFYSDEARQLDTKAREWNMRAARAYVRDKRLITNDDHLLDLHGLTVSEAQTLVREGLTQWWSRSQIQMARRKIQPLRIITGTGTHSERGQARLLPSIQKLLRNEGWLFDVTHPGCFVVKGVRSTT
ncbi:hypothetical protein BCR42DRAFT_414733 [Absidia repens]|uniref:Smr domain-containing protein n=1 Tax=Absidia repens TaxID=90262 RepID=A0A1X2IGL2_9FUNG|nr:hypothetical protein BCR42DRAFT_414733 [Absidia repens]